MAGTCIGRRLWSIGGSITWLKNKLQVGMLWGTLHQVCRIKWRCVIWRGMVTGIQIISPWPQHDHLCQLDVSGIIPTTGSPHEDCQAKRGYQGWNGWNHHSAGILCRLAESLVGIWNCKENFYRMIRLENSRVEKGTSGVHSFPLFITVLNKIKST